MSLFPRYSAPVEHALFILGYRNLAAHVVGHVSLSLLVAAGTWLAAPTQRVAAWLAWMLFLAMVFCLGVWMFRHQASGAQSTEADLRRWRHANLWIETLPGLGWGSIGFLFVAGAPVNNLLVMTAFAGALAYSAVGNAHDLRGFVVSVSLATALLLVQIPRVFDDYAAVVIGMCLLYLTMMVWVALNAHKTLLESIELRLANQVLAQKNADSARRAEQANRDKSEFLAAASHDLRQPVHALLLLIEAYRQQDGNAAKHPLVQSIASAGQSIATLFNALMELSRLESGMEQPVLTDFVLDDALKLLLGRIGPVAQSQGIFLRSFVASSCRGVRVHTDKLLFERIVGNLLANAVRYTQAGGVLLSLRLAHASAGLWLEVWDSGMGIDPLDQARIFDPYVQVANRERDRSKGLGLGLAIVRHACDLLGLTVTLRSRLGHGSCFRLLLPNRALTHAVAPSAPARLCGEAVLLAPWLAGRRVLLIDDDKLIQQAMRALLGNWGLELRCSDLADASVWQSCADGWVPDCAVCDFRLPGALDGIAMLDLLQQRFPAMAGILQTGELAQTVQARAEEAGYLVLFKPVAAALLTSTLTALLERRDLPRTT